MDSFKYRALVVDDDPSIRQRATQFLALEGFGCHQAHDGRAALEMLKQQQYDVIVTDLRMPREHGYALVQHMRDATERPLVIVLTGVAEPKLVRPLLLAGVDDMMFKPIDLKMFAAKVRVLVEARQRSAPGCSSVPALNPPTTAAAENESRAVALAPTTDRSHTVRPLATPTPVVTPQERKQDAAPVGVRHHAASLDTILHEFRTSSPSPRTRRHLRVSAALLLAVILAAGCITWTKFKNNARAISRSPTSGQTITITAANLSQMLARLKGVSPEQMLNLKVRNVTDQELLQVAHLQNVVGLDLRGAPITDSALATVAKMRGLTRLSLRDTPITTAGMQHVRLLPHLTELDVSHTKIDDESLEVIANIPQLTLIDLSGNQLSTPAVLQMRRRRPDVTVLW